jgi:hypothetical protein
LAMTKRRKILLLLAGLVLAFGAYLLFLRDKEPTYHGRKLSKWVLQYGSGGAKHWSDGDPWEAIKIIGPRAVPYLLRWME